MEDAELLEKIREVSEKRHEHHRLFTELTDELDGLFVDARKAKIPVTEIAVAASLSRQAIYDHLNHG